MSKSGNHFNWLVVGLLVSAGGFLVWSGRQQAFDTRDLAHAAQEETADINDDKPFAQAHIIMQLNDAEPSHYNASLAIAYNLINHYGGADQVDVELIAFGAGVPMLFAENNANEARIRSLMNNGVRFYICGNTLNSIAQTTGKRPIALAGVEEVPTGVAFLVEEMARGYQHVHP